MAVCDDVINYDVEVDCANLPGAGLEDDAILINRADIDYASCVFDAVQKNIITDLVLKATKRGYKVKQMKTSLTGQSGSRQREHIETVQNTPLLL